MTFLENWWGMCWWSSFCMRLPWSSVEAEGQIIQPPGFAQPCNVQGRQWPCPSEAGCLPLLQVLGGAILTDAGNPVFSRTHCSFWVKLMKNDSPGCRHSWGSRTQARVSWEERRLVLSQRDGLCFPAEGRKQHRWDVMTWKAAPTPWEWEVTSTTPRPCKK